MHSYFTPETIIYDFAQLSMTLFGKRVRFSRLVSGQRATAAGTPEQDNGGVDGPTERLL